MKCPPGACELTHLSDRRRPSASVKKTCERRVKGQTWTNWMLDFNSWGKRRIRISHVATQVLTNPVHNHFVASVPSTAEPVRQSESRPESRPESRGSHAMAIARGGTCAGKSAGTVGRWGRAWQVFLQISLENACGQKSFVGGAVRSFKA